MATSATRAGARERILDTASRLFYEYGVNSVGIDRIIAESGVAKASLYKHFPSKDALVAAWLDRRDGWWFEWFEAGVEQASDNPTERLLAVFDVLGRWFDGETYRGCAFINTTAEVPDRTHPAHTIVTRHMGRLREDLRGWADAAGAHDPDALAEQLFLLVEGAIVTSLVRGDATSAATARAAAATLLAAGVTRTGG